MKYAPLPLHKTFSIRMKEKDYKKFRKAAAQQDLRITQLARTLILAYLENLNKSKIDFKN